MGFKLFKTVFSVFAATLVLVLPCTAGPSQAEQHTEVAMRMIGHRVLLNAGDSISRVLPVQKNQNQYTLRFDSDFSLDPERLASTVDSVISVTDIATAYFVEVKDCASGYVVYSYEVGKVEADDVLPCRARTLPVGCYVLFITLTDGAVLDSPVESAADTKGLFGSSAYLWGIVLFVLVGLFWYRLSRKRKIETQRELISIGNYRFDQKSMALFFKDERTELTGKESELLYLLYSSANSTVERELILEKVWGDQGDYVGRTLDVFISKLRKKLEADSRVQIKNIRGVGYKLVLSIA